MNPTSTMPNPDAAFQPLAQNNPESPAPQTQAAIEANEPWIQADVGTASPTSANVPDLNENPRPGEPAPMTASDAGAPAPFGGNIANLAPLPPPATDEGLHANTQNALPEVPRSPAEPHPDPASPATNETMQDMRDRTVIPTEPSTEPGKAVPSLDTSIHPADPANPSSIARVENGVLKVDSAPAAAPPLPYYADGPVQAVAPAAELGGSSVITETGPALAQETAPASDNERKFAAKSPAEQAFALEATELLAKFNRSMANPH